MEAPSGGAYPTQHPMRECKYSKPSEKIEIVPRITCDMLRRHFAPGHGVGSIASRGGYRSEGFRDPGGGVSLGKLLVARGCSC